MTPPLPTVSAFTASLFLLAAALLAQLGAIALALAEWRNVGRHRLAWACVLIALVLLLQRRLAPLELALSTGLYDLPGAAVACAISALFFVGMYGLRQLFAELGNQHEHLLALAGTDALTGLANRRQLFERASQELLRTQRSGEPLAVLMFDLDHFKTVNDRYGHATGDALLQAIAEALRTTLRRIDIAGRIGGEEFVVLLPETDADAALVAAERLRLAVAEATATHQGEKVAVTTSIGIAIADSHHVHEADAHFRELLQEADTALYMAKYRGRNRVELWTPEMAIQAS